MQTIVKNISGAPKYFGFIPPHGKTLADDASVTVEGDLRSLLNSGRRYSHSRELASLNAEILAGNVEVDEVVIGSPSLGS